MSKPILYYTIGIPGSGKSTWCENNKERLNAIVHSSDDIRKKEFGDENDQSKNNDVFEILHKRVKEDLLSGKNVIYDATNLKRKNRLHFLNQIKNIPCEKVCVLFATPIEICKQNNAARDRKVPEEVIDRMVKSFDVPCIQEKWDEIQIVWWDCKKMFEADYYNWGRDIIEWCNVSHDSPFHKLSIGEHMFKASEYFRNKEIDVSLELSLATFMHDCGKVACKDFHDHNGESEIAHYYGHEQCGSYYSLFYLKRAYPFLTDEQILYISLLIGLHMRPFNAYNQNPKTEVKDRMLYGGKVIDNLLLLHDADLYAH